MPKIINIRIRDKIAKVIYKTEYICGNSDFVVNFDFDEEWDKYTTKTARFIFDGKFIDVVFQGNQCQVPVIYDTRKICIGVYAGDLRSTTHAEIVAMKSILCGGGLPAAPTDNVYAQIISLLKGKIPEELLRESCKEYVNNLLYVEEIGDTITWDGNTDGLENVSMWYRVHSNVDDVLANIELFKKSMAVDTTGFESRYASHSDDVVCYWGDNVVIALKDGAVYTAKNKTFHKKGVYFACFYQNGETEWTKSLTVPEFTFRTKEFDEDLLPDLPDTVVHNGDSGLILTSPHGIKYQLTVGDGGDLTTTLVT